MPTIARMLVSCTLPSEFQNTNGPTIWRLAEGKARRTSKPPRGNDRLDGVAGELVAGAGFHRGAASRKASFLMIRSHWSRNTNMKLSGNAASRAHARTGNLADTP